MIKRFFKSKFVFAIFLLLTLLLFAILGYKYISGHSWINAIYMAIITISFVGFEELDASSESKIFVIILVISSAIILGYSIKIIDGFTKVTDKDAAIYTQKLAKEEAMFLGNSAGAAIKGLLQLKSKFNKDDVVVVLFHDHGSRYVGKMFNDDWMKKMGYIE